MRALRSKHAKLKLPLVQTKYADQGFAVLFFPCNQFCEEEPGSPDEIKDFYVEQHGLPASSLMERGDVNGANTQDVYRFLRSAQLPNQTNAEPIEWNFSKFIVGCGSLCSDDATTLIPHPHAQPAFRSAIASIHDHWHTNGRLAWQCVGERDRCSDDTTSRFRFHPS
eukprot:SAG11_NODE_15399_length_579_cov_1.475000_1_plen_166_part_01